MEDDMAQTENLTLRQVATWLQVSDRRVLEMMSAGTLKGLKVGSHWRFRAEDIEAYLKGLATTGTDLGNHLAQESQQE
jgi:excisionase family DNA binding protein